MKHAPIELQLQTPALRSSIVGRFHPSSCGANVGLQIVVAAIVGLVLFAPPPARASVVVAYYSFQPATGTPFSSTGADPSSTAGDVVIGAGLSGAASISSTNVASTYPPALVMATNATPATEALAVSGNDYFSFTVTPTSGMAFAFDRLYFVLVGYKFFNLPSIDEHIAVRWSVDSFATTLGTVSHSFFLTGATSSPFENVDLSTLPAQSGPTEFRLYFYDATNDSSFYQQVGIDDLGLLATVIPEPSALTLILLGSCLIAPRRRVK